MEGYHIAEGLTAPSTKSRTPDVCTHGPKRGTESRRNCDLKQINQGRAPNPEPLQFCHDIPKICLEFPRIGFMVFRVYNS